VRSDYQPWERIVVTVLIVAAVVSSSGTIYLTVETELQGSPSLAVPLATTLHYGTGPDVIGIDSLTGDAYFENVEAAQITIVNHTSFASRAANYSGGGAYGMTFDRVNNNLYLVARNWESAPPVYGYVDAISLRSASEVSALPIGQGFPFPEVGIDQITGRVFVEITRYTNTSLGPYLILGISPQNNSVVTTTSIPSGASGFMVDDLNGYVYVPNGAPTGVVTVVNETTGGVVRTISVGPEPAVATLDSGNGNIYVANQGSDTVSVISGISNQVIATIPVQGTPYSILSDHVTGNVFVAAGDINWSYDSLSAAVVTAISGATSTVLGSIPFGHDFQDFVGDTATGSILCETAGSLTVINSTTNRIVEAVPEPLSPTSIAFDPLTGQVYLSSWETGTVAVLSGIPVPPVAATLVGLPPGLAFAIYAQSVSLAALAITVLASRWPAGKRSQ
jgi:YVTN family beta-propeller protein